MPQKATLTPFKTLIAAFSYLIKSGFNPEKLEKIWKLSTLSFMKLTSFRKKAVLSAYAK